MCPHHSLQRQRYCAAYERGMLVLVCPKKLKVLSWNFTKYFEEDWTKLKGAMSIQDTKRAYLEYVRKRLKRVKMKHSGLLLLVLLPLQLLLHYLWLWRLAAFIACRCDYLWLQLHMTGTTCDCKYRYLWKQLLATVITRDCDYDYLRMWLWLLESTTATISDWNSFRLLLLAVAIIYNCSCSRLWLRLLVSVIMFSSNSGHLMTVVSPIFEKYQNRQKKLDGWKNEEIIWIFYPTYLW